MTNKTAWLALLLTGVGVLLLGSVGSFAQRDFRGQGSASEVGRFQAVNVSRGEIILLDTATGDLFTAGPKDVKPLSSRRRDMSKDTGEPSRLDTRPRNQFLDKKEEQKFDDKRFEEKK